MRSIAEYRTWYYDGDAMASTTTTLKLPERMRDFMRAAMAADAAVEAGGAVYLAEDVHAWMERLAKGEKPPRPSPRRK